MISLGVFAAALNSQREILLCHRRDLDMWEMPGGGVEAHESPWEAVRREVTEETGLEIVVRRLSGLYWRPSQAVLVLQFEARVTGGTVHTSAEADDVRFVHFDDLPERMNPVVAERIRDVLTGHPAPKLATQHGPSGVEWEKSLPPSG